MQYQYAQQIRRSGSQECTKHPGQWLCGSNACTSWTILYHTRGAKQDLTKHSSHAVTPLHIVHKQTGCSTNLLCVATKDRKKKKKKTSGMSISTIVWANMCNCYFKTESKNILNNNIYIYNKRKTNLTKNIKHQINGKKWQIAAVNSKSQSAKYKVLHITVRQRTLVSFSILLVLRCYCHCLLLLPALCAVNVAVPLRRHEPSVFSTFGATVVALPLRI